MNQDLISRQDAIDALGEEPFAFMDYEQGLHDQWADDKEAIEQLPSVQPIVKDINVPCTDTISRQATIDEIEMLLEQSEDDEHDKTWNDAIRGSINAIKHHAPSVQPESSEYEELDFVKERERIPVTLTVQPQKQTTTYPVDGEPLDCISRQQAILTIERNAYRRDDINETEHIIKWVLDILKWLPSVQPEIIRCEKCRWGREACGNIECFVDSNLPPEYHGYEWFCPNGERRTDE